VVQNWLQILIFISFECVVLGSSVDNPTQILMQALMHEGGLTKDLVGMKLITFSANGVFVFQSTRLSVTQQISNGWAPHFHGASLHGSQNQFGNSNFIAFVDGE
jgi:hypothetical protein